MNKIKKRKDEESRATKIQAMPCIYSCKHLHFIECNHANSYNENQKIYIYREPHQRGIPQNEPAASKNADDSDFTIYNYYITGRLMNLAPSPDPHVKIPVAGKTRHYSHGQNPCSQQNVELHLICTQPLVGDDL